jgi:hypothetical protein
LGQTLENKTTVISERKYLLLLCLGLLFFSIFLWVWWIPNGLEYNLGVNLFTSSIFTVFTVVFLSLLFTVRENREWRRVKDEVYFMIGLELSMLFHEVSDLIEGEYDFITSLLSMEPEKNKQLVFAKLEELSQQKAIKLNPRMLSFFFEEDVAMQSLKEIKGGLRDVQMKYSRFLPSEITLSLISIQREIEAIRILHTLNALLQKKQIASLLARASICSSDVQTFLQGHLLSIIKEMYKIWKMGIEFSCP